MVPTRGRDDLVGRAIASALGQTVADVEVIVVDDGSSPPLDLDRDDPRLRVLRQPSPTGVCAARNRGLADARCPWVVFLDDDDELLPHMLEISLAAAAASTLPRPVVVLSAIEVVDPSGSVLEVRRPPTFSRGRHYFLEDTGGRHLQTQNTLLAQTELLRTIGGWDEQLRSLEHDDFFLRLNLAASIQGIDEVTYRLTAHDGYRLSADLDARADAMVHTLDKHRPYFEIHRRRYARYLGAMGITHLRAGRWRPAVGASARSVLRDPIRPTAYRDLAASLAGPRAKAWYSRQKRRRRRR